MEDTAGWWYVYQQMNALRLLVVAVVVGAIYSLGFKHGYKIKVEIKKK